MSFTVVAQGANPLVYQWMFGTNAILGATNSVYSLANAHLGDSGRYSVMVSNAYGSVTSIVASLTVTPGVPPTISSQPQSQTVESGDAVAISVSAAGSDPLTIQWLKDGKVVPGATNLYFSISSAQFTNAGLYDVTVSNAFGVAVSSQAQLIVLPPIPYTFKTLPHVLLPFPGGIAVDNSGTLYVADAFTNAIYKVAPTGIVRLIAGGASQLGGVMLDAPLGLALDQSRNV